MKAVLFCYFIVCFYNKPLCQDFFNSMYYNERNEFICFRQDTLYYRISNRDAFGTYSIGKGLFKLSKKYKICELKSNLMLDQNSLISSHKLNNNDLIISVEDKIGNPLEYVFISIKNKNDNNPIISAVSDEHGNLNLSNEIIDLIDGKQIVIEIKTIDFVTEKTVVIKSGYNYIVHSLISRNYPFTINNKKIKFINMGPQIITIKYGNNKKTSLKIGKKNISCSELFFQ